MRFVALASPVLERRLAYFVRERGYAKFAVAAFADCSISGIRMVRSLTTLLHWRSQCHESGTGVRFVALASPVLERRLAYFVRERGYAKFAVAAFADCSISGIRMVRSLTTLLHWRSQCHESGTGVRFVALASPVLERRLAYFVRERGYAKFAVAALADCSISGIRMVRSLTALLHWRSQCHESGTGVRFVALASPVLGRRLAYFVRERGYAHVVAAASPCPQAD